MPPSSTSWIVYCEVRVAARLVQVYTMDFRLHLCLHRDIIVDPEIFDVGRNWPTCGGWVLPSI